MGGFGSFLNKEKREGLLDFDIVFEIPPTQIETNKKSFHFLVTVDAMKGT